MLERITLQFFSVDACLLSAEFWVIRWTIVCSLFVPLEYGKKTEWEVEDSLCCVILFHHLHPYGVDEQVSSLSVQREADSIFHYMVEVVDANDYRYQCVITAIICWLLGKLGKVSQKGKLLNGFMKTRFLGSFVPRTTLSAENCDSGIPSLCHFRRNDNIQQPVSSTCNCILLPGRPVLDDCV